MLNVEQTCDQGGNNLLKGIDVSTFQGGIDFGKAKNAIDFVIIRTGYKFTTDTLFRSNAKMAKENGVTVLGVYHFSYALSEGEAVKEAQYCISEVEIAGLPKSTIIFYDFEYDSVRYAAKKGIKMGSKDVNNLATAFCEACKAAGYRTGIYLNLDYYRNWYYADTLKNYMVWLADYTGGPDYPCDVHQYTSKGTIPGISGNVDMNYIYRDEILEAPSYKAGKSITEVANEVIAGLWGNGKDRKDKLAKAGYDYAKVQAEVNNILNGGAVKDKVFKDTESAGIASRFRLGYSNVYTTTTGLYLRAAAGTNKKAICLMPKGTAVVCYGYYEPVGESTWLYVQTSPFDDGKVYTGFCHMGYLKI